MQAAAPRGFGYSRTAPFFGNGRASIASGAQIAQNDTHSPFGYRPNAQDRPMVVAPELNAVPFPVAAAAMGQRGMKFRGKSKKTAIINAKRGRRR